MATDFHDTADLAPKKKRAPSSERAYFQPAVVVWIARNLRSPHKLIAHDRSEAKTQMQHLWEKQRGMVAGTPDLELAIDGGAIWLELKVGKNKPSDSQEQFGRAIEVLKGHWWFPAWTVVQVCDELMLRGLDVHPLGRENALAADRMWTARVVAPRKVSTKPQRLVRSRRTGGMGSTDLMLGGRR